MNNFSFSIPLGTKRFEHLQLVPLFRYSDVVLDHRAVDWNLLSENFAAGSAHQNAVAADYMDRNTRSGRTDYNQQQPADRSGFGKLRLSSQLK